ncbi:MAG: hypothetical protein H7Y42_01525 [Chitinophagaceae bacterium]|nr:hypothetical protein [Chitinophagaceae bacterium]
MPDKKDKKDDKDKKNSALKPDPETLHTTDPQEEMEGPLSSIMQNIKDDADEHGGEEKEGAEKNK